MQTRLLTLDFSTALHHGSGTGLVGIVDRAILRDSAGMPYLAGSALKGKFRFAAQQVLDSSCEFCNKPACRSCRLFGTPRRESTVLFDDAYPPEPLLGILKSQLELSGKQVLRGATDVRAGAGIDRRRRIVETYHLFSTETLPPSFFFEGRIRGPLDDEQEKLLHQCALVLTHFGADSARGLGRCRFTVGSPEEDA
jgi:CRISPR/Cas system CSM-associated protein Csm3 (group 7 of RAMP superfamily)